MRNVKKMILGVALLVCSLIYVVIGLFAGLINGWLGMSGFAVLVIIGGYFCIDGYLSVDD